MPHNTDELLERAKAFFDERTINGISLANPETFVPLLMRAFHLAENKALAAEVKELREKVHKSDGMANEINILTREVKGLREMVQDATTTLAKYGCFDNWEETDDFDRTWNPDELSDGYYEARECIDRIRAEALKEKENG